MCPQSDLAGWSECPYLRGSCQQKDSDFMAHFAGICIWRILSMNDTSGKVPWLQRSMKKTPPTELLELSSRDACRKDFTSYVTAPLWAFAWQNVREHFKILQGSWQFVDWDPMSTPIIIIGSISSKSSLQAFGCWGILFWSSSRVKSKMLQQLGTSSFSRLWPHWNATLYDAWTCPQYGVPV